MDEQFIISIILRARDELAEAFGKARQQIREFEQDAERTRRSNETITSSTDKTTRSVESLAEAHDDLIDKAQKLSREYNDGRRSREDFEFGINRIAASLQKLAGQAEIGSQISFNINRAAADVKRTLAALREGEKELADDILRGLRDGQDRERAILRDREQFWRGIWDTLQDGETGLQSDMRAQYAETEAELERGQRNRVNLVRDVLREVVNEERRAAQITRQINESEAADRVRVAQSRIASEQARAGGVAPDRDARGRSALEDLAEFRRNLARSAVSVEEARVTLRRLAGEMSSVSREYEVGSDKAVLFGVQAENLRDQLRRVGREEPTRGWLGSIENAGVGMQRAGVHVRSLGSEMRGLLILGVIGFFQQLATAAIALGGNLVALAGSASMAGAAIGGALAAGAAQAIPAIGLVAAALARVGAVQDALQQQQNAQQQRAVQAQQSSEQQVDAAGRVKDAQDALADAQIRLQDSHRRVADAGREVADRQRALAEAQENLTRVREDAADQLDDLVFSERRAELQARGTSISLEEAQRELQEALATGDNLRIRQARLGVDEARLARDEARDNLQEVRSSAQEARRLGVEGDPQVVAARRQVEDARRGVQDARRGVAEAQRGVADAARGIEAARRNMAEAQREATQANEQVVTAQRNLDYLLSQMSEAELGLYRAMLNLRNRYEALIRPITDIIVESFSRTVDRVALVMGDSRVLGGLRGIAIAIASAIDAVTEAFTDNASIGQFSRIMGQSADSIGVFTGLAIKVGDILLDIAESSGPAFLQILEWVDGIVGGWREFIGSAAESGRLGSFFEDGVGHLQQWLRLVGAIVNLFAALFGEGGGADSGLRIITRITDGINGWADSVRDNAGEVNRFFRDSEAVLEDIWRLVKEIAIAIFNLFDPASVEALVNILIDVILPALEIIIDRIGDVVQIVEAFLGLPFVGEIAKWSIVVLGLWKALTTVFGILGAGLLQFVNMATAVRGLATFTGGLAAAFGALVRTGFGVAGIRAAIAAFRQYTAAAAAARTAATSVAATTGAVGAGAVGAAAGRRGGRLGRAGRVAGVAGLALGAAAVSESVGDDFREQAGGGIRDIPANLAQDLKALGQSLLSLDVAGAINSIGRAFDGTKQEMFDFAQVADRDFKKAIEERDVDRLRELAEQARKGADRFPEYADSLNQFADQAEAAAEQAQELNGRLRGLERFGGSIRGGLIKPEDIIAPNAVAQFLSNLRRMRDGGVRSIEDLRQNMRFNLDQINRGVEEGSESWQISMSRNFGAGIRAIRQGMRDGTIDTRDGMREIARITRTQMRFVRDNMDELSTEARIRLGNNFAAAREAVERQAGGIENATGATLRRIRRLMRQELELYGLTPNQARNIARGGIRGGQFGSMSGGGGNEGGLAGGGWIGMRGERGADGGAYVAGVPVGRGELLIANASQQKVIDDALHGQYGFGIARLIERYRGAHAGELGTGWAGGYAGRTPSGNRSVPIPGFPGEFIAQQVLDEALALIRRFRLFVTDAFATGGHQGRGHLHFGTAMDVVPGAGGSWDMVDRAVAYARSKGMTVLYDGVPNHGRGHHAHIELQNLGRLLAGAVGGIGRRQARVRGAEDAGTLGQIAQGAADNVRSGANRMLERVAAAMGMEGQEDVQAMSADADVVAAFRQAIRRTGASGRAALALWMAGIVESGLRNLPYGDADSEGALQLRVGLHGRGLARNPLAAAIAFLTRGFYGRGGAIEIAASNPRMSAGMVAQNVQGSAYPGKYDEVRSQALRYMGAFATGGVLPGLLGQAGLFIGHGREWVLNEDQKAKLTAITGMPLHALRDVLGFRGGPTEFQGGGELAFQTRARQEDIREGDYRLPAILPLSVAGIVREMRRLNFALRRIERDGDEKMNAFVNRFLREMDGLVGQGGLLEQLNAGMERRRQRRETSLTRATFRVGAGRQVTRRLDESQVAARQLALLEAEGTDLRTARGRAATSLSQGQQVLGNIDARIRRLRQGRENAAQRREIQQLLARRQDVVASNRAIQDAIRGFDAQIAENIQARFEAQLAVFRAKIESTNQRFDDLLAGVDYRQRMANVFAPNFAANASLIAERGSILTQQRNALTGLLGQAIARGDRDSISSLYRQIADLNVAIQENTKAALDNTRAQRQAAIDRISGRGDFLGGVGQGLTGIVNTLGAISGTVDIAELLQIAQTAGSILRETGAGLRGQLLSGFGVDLRGLSGQSFVDAVQRLNFDRITARMGQEDREQFESLINAIIQNEAAVNENTQEIKTLNGTGSVQSFSTTLWQMFRSPIFNGSGSVLPAFMPIPSFHEGGVMPWDGPANLLKGERVLRPGQSAGDTHHWHITHPVERFDPGHAMEVVEFKRSHRRAT